HTRSKRDWSSDVCSSDLAEIARVWMAGPADYDHIAGEAAEVFQQWRLVPAPKRGQIVREIADELRSLKADLGALVSVEMGKILRSEERRVGKECRARVWT